ncbi:hypothetical protein EL22_23195 [Halostagnicola sp. A56]|uniref:DUF58 domain-containing protein n=1 Tax=Halostagnicola sp. A56 TaxID=1495067 RepID=UPI0004A1887E|nr:DUF58 domain-containing protein [Halostagnicola sp. A56]KDE59321.1 hypothetical protein EL22_23195 [Halostagnicola sp. A56]
MSVRTGWLALGLLSFFGGVAVLSGAVGLGVGRGALVAVACGLLIGAIATLSRRRGSREQTGTPDPERTYRVPAPGSSLADAIGQLRETQGVYTAHSRRFVDGLRTGVVAVLTRFEGRSAEEAQGRLEAGEWTDDRRAAALLSKSVDPPSSSLRRRLSAAVNRETTFRNGIRRAGASIARIGYGDGSAASDSNPLPKYEETDSTRTDRDPRTTSKRLRGTEHARERATEYWTGVGAVALFAVGIGALAESPAVVLAGVVGVGYAGFARAFDPPVPKITLDRAVSNESPEPGDEVDVTLTVTNETDRLLPDLRLVDGVPPGLTVTDGTARIGTALRPNESVALEYTVTARRGTHEFDPALVLTRDPSRSSERQVYVGEDTSIVSAPVLRPIAAPVPLRATAASFAGRLQTTDGGTGTAFHSVREYRRNDPLNRIDWNRHARTGELATLEFHEERAARVVLLLDTRIDAYLAPSPDDRHAVDRSVAAAGRTAATLLENGDTVGLAAIGPGRSTAEEGASSKQEPCWLAPAAGRHHRVEFERLLATHSQFSAVAPKRGTQWFGQLRTLRRRFSAETQILFFSPLCDAGSLEIAQKLEARGYPVTVVSPDPTTDRTTAQQLAGVARRIRQFDLQRAGIPVVDWEAGESIDDVFARVDAGDMR